MVASLARGSRVDEFGLWDGEGYPFLPTLLGDDGEQPLQVADGSSMGIRCYYEGEIVYRGDHNSYWNRQG